LQQKKNLGKRSRIEAAKESDVESSVGDDVSESDTGSDQNTLRNKIRQASKRQRTGGDNFRQKQFG
jgi:hypothetical protein